VVKILTDSGRSFSMSEEESKGEAFHLKAADGSEIKIRCPVCSADRFGSARPPQSKPGIGFQHVIIGRELESGSPGNTLSLPVKFKFCLNCGFILKFIIDQTEKDTVETLE
jgi:hypothetical protein